MITALPIYTIEMLRPLLNRTEVIFVVRGALIRHAEGAVQSLMPGQLTFPDVNGESAGLSFCFSQEDLTELRRLMRAA